MNSDKFNPFKIFILLQMALCLFLLYFRIYWTKDNWYTFLLWNLFLGLIPLYTSRKLFQIFHQPSVTSFMVLGVTILFLPNAPYLITDLIHLHNHHNIPLWYDGLMIFTFAITGLSWGLYSIRFIHKWLALWLPNKIVWVALFIIQLASGFGVFLGRVHRLNSWDFFNRPYKLIELVLQSLTQRECWMMSISFGILLIALYVLVHISIQYLKQHDYALSKKNLE